MAPCEGYNGTLGATDSPRDPTVDFPPMIELTNEPIDSAAVLAAVSSTHAGAVLLFLVTVRDTTGERHTKSLDYECYPEMTRQKLAELEAEARRRWSLIECILVHRLGHMDPGEASVAVAISSPHRQAAFEAGKWLIDTLKEVVPIWKRENWADGSSEWVHPGMAENAERPSNSAMDARGTL